MNYWISIWFIVTFYIIRMFFKLYVTLCSAFYSYERKYIYILNIYKNIIYNSNASSVWKCLQCIKVFIRIYVVNFVQYELTRANHIFDLLYFDIVHYTCTWPLVEFHAHVQLNIDSYGRYCSIVLGEMHDCIWNEMFVRHFRVTNSIPKREGCFILKAANIC